MLKILSEKTNLPEMTLVKGIYNNKDFTLSYYLDGTIKLSGDFTEIEKNIIFKEWINNLY